MAVVAVTTHPFVGHYADEPSFRSPWMDWQPDVVDCDHRCPQHDREVARLRQLLAHLADLDEHQRAVIAGYQREVANLTAANEALRRHIDPRKEAS